MEPVSSDTAVEKGRIVKSSKLNPDAPHFHPSVKPNNGFNDQTFDYPVSLEDSNEFTQEFHEIIPPEWNVEDFSPEWWQLIHTSAPFREYWMKGYSNEDGQVDMFCEDDGAYYLESEFKTNEASPLKASVEGQMVEGTCMSVKEALGLDKMSDNNVQMKLKKLEINTDKACQSHPKKMLPVRIQQPR